jgi:hypothetical protein
LNDESGFDIDPGRIPRIAGSAKRFETLYFHWAPVGGAGPKLACHAINDTRVFFRSNTIPTERIMAE